MTDEPRKKPRWGFPSRTEEGIRTETKWIGDAVAITPLDKPPDPAQMALELLGAALRELSAPGQDDKRRAQLHHHIGVVVEQGLVDPRRALAHYLEAYRLAPTDAGVLHSLRRLAFFLESWALVLELLDAELRLAPSPPRLARLLLQKGRVLEERLANPRAARAAYEDGLAKDPGNRELLLRLRRLVRKNQEPALALEIHRQAAAATRDRKYRSLLYGEMARIQEGPLANPEAALQSYEVAFAEDPANATVRAALRRLSHQKGRWSELVEVLLTEGDLAQSDEERVASYLDAARLCRDRLGQEDRALRLFQRAQEIIPDSPSIQGEMAELLQKAGRHADLADVHRRRLACLRDDWERMVTHYHLGQVLEERLGQEEEALEHYRAAVDLDPTYVPALRALGKLYQRRGAWVELLEVSAQEVEAMEDRAARASRFYSLADLCETKLVDPARAVEFHKRALASIPFYAPSEHALERLYPATGDYESLVALLERKEAPASTGAPLLERLGQLCEERLADPARAASYYRLALEAAPRSAHLLRALERVYERAGRFEDLLWALDREAELATDESLAAALSHKAAEICESRLGNVEEAIRRYRAILDRGGAHTPTLTSLGRIYYRVGSWREVLDLYRLEVEQPRVVPERASSLLYKMGEIYEERLEDIPSALASYRRALEVSTSFLPALQALARLYKSQKDWDHLLEILGRQAEVLSDPGERAAALCRIAELCETHLSPEGERAGEAAGARELAASTYAQAFDLAPGYEPPLFALVRLLGAQKRWREIAELYERAIEATVDEAVRTALLDRAAEVWESILLDDERAISCYERAIALDGTDVEALDALARLYRKHRRDDRLVDVLERLAARSEDPREAVGLLYETASLLELRGDARDLAPLFERILQLAPEEQPALESLGRLYTQRGDHQNLVRVFLAHAHLLDEPEAKVALLLRAAAAQEATGDPAGALRSLEHAARLGEAWLPTRELLRLQMLLGRWEEVAESLERLAGLSLDRPAVQELLLRSAQLLQDRFEDTSRAVSVLTRVLQVAPYHETAMQRLEQLLVQKEDWRGLVEALRARLEATVGTKDRPQTGSATQARLEMHTRMAWILREHLDQPAEAAAALERALQLLPDHQPTLLSLGTLYTSLGQWQEAARTYSRIAATSVDPDLLRTVHLRLGDLMADRLGDPGKAISSFQNVLAIAPADEEALQRLAQLFTRRRDFENAADLLSRLVEVTVDPARRARHLLALAEVQERGFGDARLAVESLQRALSIEPSSEETLRRLTGILARLSSFQPMCDAIRSFLAALPADQQERGVPFRLMLGDILRQRLGRPAEGLEQVRAVVEIDPTHTEARLAAAEILAAEGRLDEAIFEHRELLEIDPLNLESLRRIQALFAKMGKGELAYAVSAALVCLGDQPSLEAKTLENVRGWPLGPKSRLESSAFDTVIGHPGEPAKGRALLSALSEIAHRVRPPRLLDWQIGKAERLASSSEDLLRVAVREACAALAIDREPEIFLSPRKAAELDLLLTDPPSLVAGTGLREAVPALEVKFWAAKLLAFVKSRTVVAYGLSAVELERLVLAARLAVDLPPPGLERDAELLELSRTIQQHLGRRAWRTLEEACRALGEGEELDCAEWCLAMEHTAVRAGLYVVSDLGTALHHVARQAGQAFERGAVRSVDWLRRSPLATDLIRFWLSDDLHALTTSG
jgi:cellulose synthase operon protein C